MAPGQHDYLLRPARRALIAARRRQAQCLLIPDRNLARRRAPACGLVHTFRATRITIYLTNGGTLEKAQMMAAHESPRTTKLYDRTNDAVSLDEVERVVF
jgi:hypothetical protein